LDSLCPYSDEGGDDILFHHDGLEYNDRNRPPLDLDFAARLARYRQIGSVVYLARDPRDVMVSLFHQVTGRFRDFFDFKGDISEFIRDPYFGAHNLQIFRARWDELCQPGLALKINYEGCHLDFRAVLKVVIAYFGLRVDDQIFENACQAATFENMKKIELDGNFVEPWLRLRNGSPKVRHGVVGGYHDALSQSDVEYLNVVFRLNPAG